MRPRESWATDIWLRSMGHWLAEKHVAVLFVIRAASSAFRQPIRSSLESGYETGTVEKRAGGQGAARLHADVIFDRSRTSRFAMACGGPWRRDVNGRQSLFQRGNRHCRSSREGTNAGIFEVGNVFQNPPQPGRPSSVGRLIFLCDHCMRARQE
jgi:hypothetical protein